MIVYDWLIVGAGIAGCTAAESLARRTSGRVLVVERRDHIGGNCHDRRNGEGLWVQDYGPHVLHTSSVRVFDYVSRFATLNDYVHRVRARVRGIDVPFPICIDTLEKLWNVELTALQMDRMLNDRRVAVGEVRNARDVVVSQVGVELYELFFRGYTQKQWGVPPEALDPEVTGRIPVRLDRDTRYFTDVHQGIPVGGFTEMMSRMLAHPRIEVLEGTDLADVVDSVRFDRMIYTGRLDDFFDRVHGALPYRCVEFEHTDLDVSRYQDAGVVNFPGDEPYTRVTEFKHMYLLDHQHTSVCFEHPGEGQEPCYPILSGESRELARRYRQEADRQKSVRFVGRLAEYRYLNMDQAIASALDTVDDLLGD